MSQIKYNAPNFRKGFICETSLDKIPVVGHVVDKIKKDWGIYDSMVSHALRGRYNIVEKKTFDQMKIDEYEGPAIHSPSFNVIVEHDKTEYEIMLGSTIVVCLNPYKSKIWSRASVTRINGKSAVNVDLEDNEKFFSNFQPVMDTYISTMYDYYKDSLEAIIGGDHDRSCIKLYSIDVKTLGSSDQSIGKLISPICEESPFFVIDAFRDESVRSAIMDYIHFSFGVKINSEKEYREFIEDYRKKWNNELNNVLNSSIKPAWNGSKHDIISYGYQWFCFMYRGLQSLYLRREQLDPNSSCYYGWVLDSEESIKQFLQEEDPKSSTRVLSGGIIRNLTRTI